MAAARPALDSLDSKDRAALSRFLEELQEIYAEELLVVAVTGEAASACYRAGRTPLQTLVVVREVGPGILRAARGSLRRWARARIPTPLFLDPAYLEGSLDTFPLEFLIRNDRSMGRCKRHIDEKWFICSLFIDKINCSPGVFR